MKSILIPAIKSLTVTNKYPNKSLNEDLLTVGFNGQEKYYSYLFFDTSLIPCNSLISKAELVLFKVDNFYNDNNQKFYISPLNEYFSTYTTYNNPPRYDIYTTTSFYPLTSKVSIPINIASLLSSWIKNPKSNKGLILYDKVKNGLINFTSVNSDDKPFIRITYKEPYTNKLPKEKSNYIKKCASCSQCSCKKSCDCIDNCNYNKSYDCRSNCCCNKNCDCNNNCYCNGSCVKICKDELKAIIKEACCNNPTPPTPPQPDNSTVRDVRVTGTVAPLSIYYIVVNFQVTRASSGLIDNYYVSDEYDNSLNNSPLFIDKTYNIAIIPKIEPGDTENLILYGSYKGVPII